MDLLRFLFFFGAKVTSNLLLSTCIGVRDSEVTCTIAKVDNERLIALANAQAMAYICNKIVSEIPLEYNEHYQRILNEV
jgi:hypothetical protein